ncbi:MULTISPECIES: PAS domain-containing protein [unclassified Janthinobacterium]|uniref:PAS domain-containing protein n=1 Tax=unclassified Janthinobacterium TaxID=2610881 RepID=UPI001611EDCF|nr:MULTISPECIES: PAS domain-containing protein [unclassified Janthinobacterium]MBB5368662.1 PAS domain S-box-containing protein [Janthinobacterium sp. K2C7]MBB5381802.1 PAS domain S-box-containing protein [Janthinobacterium sp. K2Li3]MBB5387044.1 PAS domain S-box-containing protein [Janthinobacterium sp. K2E3]
MHDLPSIRARISRLVLAWAVPTAIVFALLATQSYRRERDHVVSETAQAARALSATVERDIDGARMAAYVLGNSPALRNNDIAALRAQAASLLRPGFAVSAFVLSDTAGHQLFDTALPLQATPPDLTPKAAASMQRTVDRGQPRLTSLPSGAPEMPQMAWSTPLAKGNGAPLILTALYPANYLPGVMRELGMPSYLSAAIINADGINVARTRDPQRYVGQRSMPQLLEQLLQTRDGMVRHESMEGLDVYTGFHRARDDAWTAAVTMRTATVSEALLRSVLTGSAILALLLGAAFALAWKMGGRLAYTLQTLTAQIQALAQGQRLAPGRHTTRESANMAQALATLESDLQRHRTQLESLVAERTLALEQSTRLLATVYATAPIGLIFVDHDLRIVMINDYLAALNATPAASHIGRPLSEMIFNDGVRTEVERGLRQVLQTGKAIVNIEMKGYNGENHDEPSDWIVSYHPIFGPEQQLLGVSGLLLDITERRRTEAEFRHSRHLFGTIIENIPAMVFVKRADRLSFEMVNRHAELTLGRSREQLLGKTDHDFFPPQQAAAFINADRKLLATGQMVEIEQEAINTADGTTRYFTTRKVVLRDDAGRASHVLGVSIDISERKRATEVLHATTLRLEQSERFIRTVTDNLPGMVSYWGRDLRCRFANQFYTECFGRSSAELDGIHMSDLLGEELFKVYMPHVEGVLAGRPQSFERDLPAPQGEVLHTWTNYIPDFDDEGGVRGFFVLGSDVSELKRTELRLQELNEQMVRARDKAEAASIAKSNFVANMSHEIRTPMNAIIGLARLLEESPLERRERSYVSKIQMATQSLLGIVNDVLDFSKIEAGQLVLEQRRFQLERMLASIGVLLASGAWARGVEPVFVLDPRVPAELIGDALRVEQILINLVGNAVKFTSDGDVVLGIDLLFEDADTVTLEFSVRDTGIGIAAAEQEHIFDAFSQGDGSTSRKYGGTGLGLAICRRMVELMGGSLSVKSTLGQGSDFRFVCRFGRAGPVPVRSPAAPLSVLIIDDNASVRSMLEALCAAQGWHSRSADGGMAGMALLRSHARCDDGKPPADLVLLDAAMPDIDGISMLTEVRADPALKVPPVIMLVADQASENLERIADSLALAGIVSKPATPARLLAAIEAVRQGRSAPASLPISTPLSGLLAGMRVLLVEDNEINQEVAQYILLHSGARVAVAANGQLAVDLLARSPRDFDVVLMDLQMPVLNGYEATQAIRALGLTGLPIVAMTANAMDEDRLRAISSGMNAHVAKPIDVDELIQTLTRLVPGLQASDTQSQASSEHHAAVAISASVPGIDLTAALHRFGGDYGAFLALLKRFENSQGDAVAETRQLLAQGEMEQAQQLLHRLCGVAANLGASAVAGLSARAGKAIKAGQRQAGSTLLEQLEHAMGVVIEGARTLPLPLSHAAPGASQIDLQAGLAELLDLILNNNLKALAQFHRLRPALEQSDRETALALDYAIGTLHFSDAEKLVREQMKREENT